MFPRVSLLRLAAPLEVVELPQLTRGERCVHAYQTHDSVESSAQPHRSRQHAVATPGTFGSQKTDPLSSSQRGRWARVIQRVRSATHLVASVLASLHASHPR